MTTMNWPKIKIHYSFLLIILLNLIMKNFLELFTILLALGVHEIGHMIMIYFTKGKIKSIELNAFGGVINTNDYSNLLVDFGRHPS